ncbi:MAG: ERCC4 domain-containing protein [Planctomycetaceae bacterium]
MARTRKQKICPFTVIADTREQAPFGFMSIEPWDKIEVESRALQTGDYSIVGFESVISVERKSVSDFYHSIGSDRERFEREMVRLQQMEFAAVVIEGNWKELLIDRPDTIQMSAKSASNTIYSWSVRYGVHFWTCDGRRHAELTTFRLLWHFWKQQQEKNKDIDWIDDAIEEALEATLF